MNKKIPAFIGRIAFILTLVFLIVYLITVISGSADFFNESAEEKALYYLQADIERTNQLARAHYKYLDKIADKMTLAESRADVVNALKDYIGADEVGDLRFYSDGIAYDSKGTEVDRETSGAEEIEKLVSAGERGCTEVYFDKMQGMNCIAFYINVQGSEHVDGLLSMVPARNIINLGELINGAMLSAAVIDRHGNVLAANTADGFPFSVGSDYYEFISTVTSDESDVKTVGEAVRRYEKTSCIISAHGVQYTMAISPVPEFSDNIILVTMSETDGLVASEMTYIRHLVNIVIITIISLAVGLAFAFLYYKKLNSDVIQAAETDGILGCANTAQFKKNASEVIRNRGTGFGVSVFEIRQYRYFVDTNSEEDQITVLKYIAKVIETFCGPHETYGYMGEGKFALLIDYSSDRAVREKIKLIETVVNKHELLASGKTRLRFHVGLALMRTGMRNSMTDLLDHAMIASDHAKTDIRVPFITYNDKVTAERDHDDRIEAEMENALESDEFRLFLQPKYSVLGDKIDSAEALVRWFDPRKGEYRFPGEFISLFESNGFITKLDHYIYIKVLEYVSGAAERGEKIVPIAVNVSRVTASSKDFLDFYIGNKKKYRIGDGFITLEFTESFAMEDYDKIFEIVEALHKNGMKCSIDDFGSGYSSFSILKKIPMDELKLDRLFIEAGVDGKRDDIMLETIINLAKSFGMKVVQEGVETKDMFERVIAKGVDTVQGFYYAKAIPLEEYKLFINSNTSIKFKSKVK